MTWDIAVELDQTHFLEDGSAVIHCYGYTKHYYAYIVPPSVKKDCTTVSSIDDIIDHMAVFVVFHSTSSQAFLSRTDAHTDKDSNTYIAQGSRRHRTFTINVFLRQPVFEFILNCLQRTPPNGVSVVDISISFHELINDKNPETVLDGENYTIPTLKAFLADDCPPIPYVGTLIQYSHYIQTPPAISLDQQLQTALTYLIDHTGFSPKQHHSYLRFKQVLNQHLSQVAEDSYITNSSSSPLLTLIAEVGERTVYESIRCHDTVAAFKRKLESCVEIVTEIRKLCEPYPYDDCARLQADYAKGEADKKDKILLQSYLQAVFPHPEFAKETFILKNRTHFILNEYGVALLCSEANKFLTMPWLACTELEALLVEMLLSLTIGEQSESLASSLTYSTLVPSEISNHNALKNDPKLKAQSKSGKITILVFLFVILSMGAGLYELHVNKESIQAISPYISYLSTFLWLALYLTASWLVDLLAKSYQVKSACKKWFKLVHICQRFHYKFINPSLLRDDIMKYFYTVQNPVPHHALSILDKVIKRSPSSWQIDTEYTYCHFLWRDRASRECFDKIYRDY